jgi:hypothetical protein
MSTQQTVEKNKQENKQEETTLEKMSKRGGDRAHSQAGIAERRESELEEMMEQARRMLERKSGQTVVVSQRAEDRQLEKAEKGVDAVQGAAVRSSVTTTIESRTQSGMDKEASGVLAKIGSESATAQANLKATAAGVSSMISDLTAITPPPGAGLSYMDWVESAVRRAEMVKKLEETLSGLKRADGKFGQLGAEAGVAGRIGQEEQTSRQEKKAA